MASHSMSDASTNSLTMQTHASTPTPNTTPDHVVTHAAEQPITHTFSQCARASRILQQAMAQLRRNDPDATEEEIVVRISRNVIELYRLHVASEKKT
jgi:hypothetical protein